MTNFSAALVMNETTIIECDHKRGVYELHDYSLQKVSVPYEDIADLIDDYIESNIQWQLTL